MASAGFIDIISLT